MPIPEEIRGMRPKGLFKATEVRLISGYYYVYEISSKRDGKKHRLQKPPPVRVVGKILSEEGFMPNRNYADTYHRAQRHDQYRLLYVFDRTSEAPVFYRIIPLQDRRQVRLRGEAAPLQLPGRHRHRGQGLLFEGESLISDDGEAALHPASLGQYDDDPPGIRQLGE